MRGVSLYLEPRSFRIGIDVGQRVDHSAICLIEESDKIIVRLLTKYPLGTPFPLFVKTLVETIRSVAKQGEVLGVAIDATGVGAAPSQMLQDSLPEMRVEPFVFTNKNKRELVGKVKVLHSTGRLRFATRKGDELYNRTLQELINEMKQLQARVIREDISNPEIEVFKTGTHDDLFTALALAVKDIQIMSPSATAEFIEDKSWVKTPLDEQWSVPIPVFF